MRLVILAAGIGSRLRPLTDHQPKCLIKVGDQSILERLLIQAEQLKGRFEEAVVITGYLHEQVEKFVEQWNRAHDLLVRIVHNESYDRTNNGYSLWCAREFLIDGFLLVDGDLLLDPQVLDRVSRSETSVLAVDMKSRIDEEAMKFVLDKNGHIVRLSKEIPLQEGDGESLGLNHIVREDAQAIVEHLTKLVDAGIVNDYYERAFQEYLKEGWKLGVIDIGDLPWVEVDDQNDLKRAVEKFA
ncbi:nucleotide sugar-1-phosphate transferase [Collibacillus ludicampi]|uniref:Nucleotide sugar-1-phosphate transferase n=1 Tax=Collibacillus ludicampi TaxID=2771369 RepID=A0AAV4LB11_9BACL|nr:phosphocholine cytidylyltransferase family protein [Collibacillus ludicampi]GIM44848.1 nucleotide sugar-1-phosphate transferase [Collibacillus ludicampi]